MHTSIFLKSILSRSFFSIYSRSLRIFISILPKVSIVALLFSSWIDELCNDLSFVFFGLDSVLKFVLIYERAPSEIGFPEVSVWIFAVVRAYFSHDFLSFFYDLTSFLLRREKVSFPALCLKISAYFPSFSLLILNSQDLANSTISPISYLLTRLINSSDMKTALKNRSSQHIF